MELLIHLIDLSCGHLIVDFIEDFVEVGWTVQVAVLKGLLVVADYLCDTIHSWVENVSIECKAVRRALRVGGYGPAKTVEIDHLVTVVELEDVTDASYGVEVLVAVRVKVVQGVSIARVPI